MYKILQLSREHADQKRRTVRIKPPLWPEAGAALFNTLDYESEPRVTYELHNAFVTRAGFCFSGLRLVKASFYDYPSRQKKWLIHAWGSRLRRSSERLSADDTFALVHNLWAGGYFFWITEGLPRLWSIRERWPSVVLLLPSHTGLSQVMQETVRPLPLRALHWLPATRSVRPPRLVMPGNSTHKARYEPKVMHSIRSFYLNLFGKGCAPSRKIYISRAHAAHRRLENEEALIAQLSNRGFEAVAFETLSFNEQVQLMSETKVLVGPHGAGFSNITFMPAGGVVLEFQLAENERSHTDMEDERKLNKSFCRLASVMGHDYGVISCEGMGDGGTKVRNLKLDLSELSAALDALQV